MKKNKQSHKCCSVCKVLKSSSCSLSLFAHPLTNTTDGIPVHTVMKSGRSLPDLRRPTFKIGVAVWRQVGSVIEIAQKSSFLCVTEQKPYPVFFSCRHKNFVNPCENRIGRNGRKFMHINEPLRWANQA